MDQVYNLSIDRFKQNFSRNIMQFSKFNSASEFNARPSVALIRATLAINFLSKKSFFINSLFFYSTVLSYIGYIVAWGKNKF